MSIHIRNKEHVIIRDTKFLYESRNTGYTSCICSIFKCCVNCIIREYQFDTRKCSDYLMMCNFSGTGKLIKI